jgi:hypothetical protein
MCNRAYHVRCLVPPVNPEELPEEEGWLCPACDRKVGGWVGRGWLKGGSMFVCVALC